jgi:hypothetical protein
MGRGLEQRRAVWVAEVADREALVRLIRAALVRGVASVDLPDRHLEPGPHVLQLRMRGQAVVVLSAELAAERPGETTAGELALRLAPLDPSHVPELTTIAEHDDDADVPVSSGPMSASASAIFDSEPPLPPGAALPPARSVRAFTKTLPDPEPEDVEDDELEASVLFDPEAALIGRAPARPDGTANDDTLTIPARSSMMPAASTQRNVQAVVAAAHPADADSYSVVFGTEPTSPGVVAPPGARHPRPVGVVATQDQELSLTPTAPMEVPARRPPSMRHAPPSARRPPIDLEQTVSEDGETLPRSSQPLPQSQGVPSQAASSGRGPRTMQRITGAHGIVVVGRVIAKRYRIDALVGAGAVGAVYRASHVDLPRTFAIKVLHPHCRADAQHLASFRTEARAASLLDHPNVTVVHDFGEEPDGLVYIVMEYLAGSNLQAVLDEARRFEPRRAISIMLQVCGALSAAHERGIVHRDVKPDNIMLIGARDDEGRPFDLVKVCDFGIAALESAPDASDGEWTAGTPEYMAPEQARGRAEARTDVYACGIVLYEMLTGRPPFIDESTAVVLAKHQKEIPRRPSEIAPGVPPQLDAVVMCAIQKSPERRFASMRDFRTELKRLL